MTSRLEYVLEKVEEDNEKYRATVNEGFNEYLDFDCIESCECCEHYCTSRCVKSIHKSHGDEWAEGLNNVDDALEEKFRHE